MQPIEQTGAFYLGRIWDDATGATTDQTLMYDARDLTTHAVCVGMTGSGKTGLCIGLLEEAAMDGVPALIIDPKGDIANLLLMFPDLRPEDFAPWVNADDARRKGMDIPAFAEKTAAMWQNGLADWGQDGDRIRRLRERAEFRIYTPGSTAGEPVSILASLQAPQQKWEGNEELLRDRIRGTVGAVLGLAGIEADPVRSPAHIFLSTVIEHHWRQGRNLDLADLIRSLQEPPIRKLGVFDVDTFYPPKERFELAMALNSLMASPGFAAWLEGTPLDIDKLLYTEGGRPRHAVFSIAHLDDAQRMFFVTLLLESTLAWTRRQSGTTSLRALLYMDELFGFMPPTANPPSKKPLLTLLKQARAFGVGVVLTTQNPVDLDYKGLSNTGTWFIGKLQTERDKARMLDGLEAAGGALDRGALERLIGALDSRVFLLHNVHEDEPVLMHTRWVMSYLRGPLTRDQIRRLKPSVAAASAPAASVSGAGAGAGAGAGVGAGGGAGAADGAPVGAAGRPSPVAAPGPAVIDPVAARDALREEGFMPVAPSLKANIDQVYFSVRRPAMDAVDEMEKELGRRVENPITTLVYEPCLAAWGQVGFVDSRKGISSEAALARLIPAGAEGIVVDWKEADELGLDTRNLAPEAAAEAMYGAMPRGWESVTFYRSAAKAFKDHLYRDQKLSVYQIPSLKLYGEPGESEEAFLGRARLVAREQRDAEVDKLNKKMETKLARIEKKISREERELDEDRAEYDSRKKQELISAGETLLGMFGVLGRKRSTGLSSAARKRRMTARAKEDIRESEQEIASLQSELDDLRQQMADDVAAIAEKWESALDEVETLELKPRRRDVRVDYAGLAWAPVWIVTADGGANRRCPAWLAGA